MDTIWQAFVSRDGNRYGCGLATITPASGFVGIEGGIILGLGGEFFVIAVDLIRLKLKIDDSLDVFAVHEFGGMLGTILLHG